MSKEIVLLSKKLIEKKVREELEEYADLSNLRDDFGNKWINERISEMVGHVENVITVLNENTDAQFYSEIIPIQSSAEELFPGNQFRYYCGHVCGAIMRVCLEKKWPLFNSMVVGKVDGVPGNGLFHLWKIYYSSTGSYLKFLTTSFRDSSKFLKRNRIKFVK